MPDFYYNADNIPVSGEFINKLMPEANGAYVKVYLYMLSLAVKNISEENSSIAKRLNLLESDVVNAVEYWSEHGALRLEGNSIVFGSGEVPAVAKPETAETNEDVKNEQQEVNISEKISENKALSDLCILAQEIMGKTLNVQETKTLFWFYDNLGFSAEVISMLLEYCVSKGKRNMSYIEKVAIAWHENGITTMTAVESYISDEQEKKTYKYELKKLFKINDRNLSTSEEQYLKTWHDEFDMSIDMIALAYEYCILSIGKLSFPYMNGIIDNWYKNNIRTIEEAEKDHVEFKSKNKAPDKDTNVFSDNDYNYDEIEKIMQKKYNE